MQTDAKAKLRLEDLRVESFVTNNVPEGTLTVVAADDMTSFCTCNTCDATTSASGNCGSGCGWTYCCPPFTDFGCGWETAGGTIPSG